jgi:hypothetical protein
MSMNREQELQYQIDGLMLRIAQQAKDIEAMRDKRYEIEAENAVLKQRMEETLAELEISEGLLQSAKQRAYSEEK